MSSNAEYSILTAETLSEYSNFNDVKSNFEYIFVYIRINKPLRVYNQKSRLPVSAASLYPRLKILDGTGGYYM